MKYALLLAFCTSGGVVYIHEKQPELWNRLSHIKVVIDSNDAPTTSPPVEPASTLASSAAAPPIAQSSAPANSSQSDADSWVGHVTVNSTTGVVTGDPYWVGRYWESRRLIALRDREREARRIEPPDSRKPFDNHRDEAPEHKSEDIYHEAGHGLDDIDIHHDGAFDHGTQESHHEETSKHGLQDVHPDQAFGHGPEDAHHSGATEQHPEQRAATDSHPVVIEQRAPPPPPPARPPPPPPTARVP